MMIETGPNFSSNRQRGKENRWSWLKKENDSPGVTTQSALDFFK